jgi:hypothetical protein
MISGIIVDRSLQEVHCHTIHLILELFIGNGVSSSSSSFFLFFLCVFSLHLSKPNGSMSMLCHSSPHRADILSDSLNVLVLPLPPSRHDDNCSIGTIGGGGRMPDAIAPHACSFNSSADYELALILKEIRFITDQVSSERSAPLVLCPSRPCV